MIRGSVGKGLGINETSNGNHVFFCGGTGILPFLDTFAYVLRKTLAEKESVNSMFTDEVFKSTGPEFFLSIYAFFTKRSESIGIEILDALRFLEDKYQLEVKINVNVIFT